MFKVGQKVWDLLRGPGEVIDIDKLGQPLVLFEGIKGKVRFHTNGSIGGTFNRSLFFSEPVIDGATEPPFEPTLKNGDWVVAFCKKNPSVEKPVLFQVKREGISSVDSCYNGEVYSKLNWNFNKVDTLSVVFN